MDLRYKIERVKSHEQLDVLLNVGGRETYKVCFAAPEWEEDWQDHEVDEELHSYLDHSGVLFYVVTCGDTVVGLGVGFPIVHHIAVTEHLARVPDLDLASTMYMADVAVHPDHQNQGLGSELIDTRLKNLPETCKRVVMRTAKVGSRSEPLYLRRNFQRVQVEDMMVEFRRRNGQVEATPRVFLHCRVEDIVFPASAVRV